MYTTISAKHTRTQDKFLSNNSSADNIANRTRSASGKSKQKIIMAQNVKCIKGDDKHSVISEEENENGNEAPTEVFSKEEGFKPVETNYLEVNKDILEENNNNSNESESWSNYKEEWQQQDDQWEDEEYDENASLNSLNTQGTQESIVSEHSGEDEVALNSTKKHPDSVSSQPEQGHVAEVIHQLINPPDPQQDATSRLFKASKNYMLENKAKHIR